MNSPLDEFDQLHCSVLYPAPIDLETDQLIHDLADRYYGKALGNSCDEDQRLLAFQFPTLVYQLPNPLLIFASTVLELGCVVILSQPPENKRSSEAPSLDCQQKSEG